jgi:Lipid A 3-O-deacylase (PagL)
MKLVTLILLVLLLELTLCAQEYGIPARDRGIAYTIAPHYGFIAAHTPSMEHLIQGHSRGISASILWSSTRQNSWEGQYNFPDFGIDVFVNNTGNPEQLGTQITSTFFLDLPLNKTKFTQGLKRTDDVYVEPWHRLGLGIGIGHSSKTWDLETNRQANVLGSKLNAGIVLQYKIDVLERSNYAIQTGLRITHYSNGALQLPNLGTNNLSVFTAFRWKNRRYREIPKENMEVQERGVIGWVSFIRSWHQSLGLFVGLKEIPPPYGKKFTTLTMSYLLERRQSHKSSFGIGLDVFRNSSIGVLLERRDSNDRKIDILQSGAVLSYTLHFDEFEFKIQQGFYLRDKWKDNGFLYHRFGLRYLISEKVFLNLMLKTHFAKADHGELGIGYRF